MATTIVTRGDKGAPLTHDELDQNLENLQATADGAEPADSTLFRRANILGPVSQVGGVPTGAIIERGVNANGSYTKFADGTMICNADLAFTSQDGARILRSWTFPAAFTDGNYQLVGSVNMDTVFLAGWPSNTVGINYIFNGFGYGPAVCQVQVASEYTGMATNYATVVAKVIAIGRWF